ncbi:MAG TPA: DUF2218 domain-containing protein [Candidatus Nanopelagicales bacterium]|nr:DUF2218 domain-containing protein [Candidatus Nanopelagicales bacterium]
MADPLTAHAAVATERPERYAKQLVSHLGRKAEVREEPTGSRLVLGDGSCLVVPGDGVLDLRAEAPDPESLQLVQNVIGSHLVRFGDKDELVVDWS